MVSPAVMTNAPISHQFICFNMLLEKMEPSRERILMAQKISPKLTARNAIAIASRQRVSVKIQPFRVPLCM